MFLAPPYYTPLNLFFGIFFGVQGAGYLGRERLLPRPAGISGFDVYAPVYSGGQAVIFSPFNDLAATLNSIDIPVRHLAAKLGIAVCVPVLSVYFLCPPASVSDPGLCLLKNPPEVMFCERFPNCFVYSAI